ncbi:MAG: hypothetical protein NTX01_00375 [Candidatus Omnitrophica bacterium]|nr:hypothetical protein [Candidatus Omnitrophota bacterium]
MAKMIKYGLLIFIVTSVLSICSVDNALAGLVACGGGSCPGGYWACDQATTNFDVKNLPFSGTSVPTYYTTPPLACADTMDGRVIPLLPFTVDTTEYKCIPARVTHVYNTCQFHPC